MGPFWASGRVASIYLPIMKTVFTAKILMPASIL